MGEFFKLVAEVGFPIAAALAGGYFVFLTLKLVLGSVMSSVKGLSGIITALDNRVKTMNHDVIRIDAVVSNALGLKPDVERIARADGKMMLDATNADQKVIDLHYQASQCKDIEQAKELRKQADELSDIIKLEKNAVHRLYMGL